MTAATPMKVLLVAPIVSEVMLIKNWEFTGVGTSGVAAYPYQNTLADPTRKPFSNPDLDGFASIMRKHATNGWEYYWGATEEVKDKPGIPGQNNANPKSTFANHIVVEIGGKIYDPSYGTGPFNNLLAWEDASVAGFTMRDEVVADTNYRLIFRKNPVGADIEIKATDNTV